MEALNNTLKSVAVRYMLWLEWVTRWDRDRDREFCSFLRFHEHNYCSARTGTWNALIMQIKQTKRKRELSVWNFILSLYRNFHILSFSFLLELLFPLFPINCFYLSCLSPFFFCMSGICRVSHAYVHRRTHAVSFWHVVKGHFRQWREIFSGGLVWVRLISQLSSEACRRGIPVPVPFSAT